MPNGAIGDLLPSALAVSLSPIPIVAVIMMVVLLLLGAKLLGDGLAL